MSRGGTGVAGDNVYHVTVRAASGEGERERTAEQAITVTVVDVNEAPTGLPAISGTAQVGRTLTADTSGIADPDGLGAPGWSWQWIRVTGGGGETDVSGATSSTYAPAAGDAGRTLKVRVDFTDDAGNAQTLTSAETAPVAAAAAPAAPDLTAEPGNAKVTLAWTPAEDGGRPTGWQYRARRRHDGEGNDARPWGEWADIPGGESVRTHDVTGLDNGASYAFQVRGAIGTVAGAGSRFVYATPQAPPGVPAKPAGVAAAAENRQVKLTWTPQADATGWELRRKAGTDAWGAWADIATEGATDPLRHRVTGLDNGTEYAFELRGENAQGEGAASDPVKGTPLAALVAPLGVRAEAVKHEATLHWGPVFGATGYEYRRKTGTVSGGAVDCAGGAWSAWTNVTGTDRHTVRNLATGQGYCFEVRAKNADGPGPASAVFTAVAPPVPTLAPSAVTHEGATLTLTDHGGRWWYKGSRASAACTEGDETTSTAGLTGLDAGTAYTYKAYGDSSCTVELTTDDTDAEFTTSQQAQQAPVFTSAAAFEVAENATAVGTVTAVDGDPAHADAMRYAIAGGVDGATFSVDAATGALAFKAAPDHELPLDVTQGGTEQAGDNVYHVTVRAASGEDGRERTAEQAITVTVVDVDEDPTGLPAISGTAQVGETLTADTSGIADPDGLGAPGWTWQWILVAGDGGETDVSGATASTWTPAAGDAGRRVKVRVASPTTPATPRR